MIHFLIQTIEGKIKHDFAFALEHAIEYQKWRGNDMDVTYCSLEELKEGLYEDVKDYIPIGTVEFVFAFIDKYVKFGGSNEIYPLNVPFSLKPYAKRFISDEELVDDRTEIYHEWVNRVGRDGKIFIKSDEKIKSVYNDIYTVDKLFDIYNLPNGRYQISTLVDIKSEFRCFVYKKQLLGIQYYSGDFMTFPDVTTILEMVDTYCNTIGFDATQAFTLDVAVTNTGETIVIEVHDFFSCGLYGFDDANSLPYMFIRSFYDIKNRILTKGEN